MSKLFFVKFPDGALYAAGPQQDGTIPGGPIGYVLNEDAKIIAAAISGTVVIRTLDYALQFCQSKGYTLWIKQADRGMSFVAETVPQQPGNLERVAEPERQRLIQASTQLS
jgi:hypothetical protein